jgi:hypothetical protein
MPIWHVRRLLGWMNEWLRGRILNLGHIKMRSRSLWRMVQGYHILAIDIIHKEYLTNVILVCDTVDVANTYLGNHKVKIPFIDGNFYTPGCRYVMIHCCKRHADIPST